MRHLFLISSGRKKKIVIRSFPRAKMFLKIPQEILEKVPGPLVCTVNLGNLNLLRVFAKQVSAMVTMKETNQTRLTSNFQFIKV